MGGRGEGPISVFWQIPIFCHPPPRSFFLWGEMVLLKKFRGYCKKITKRKNITKLVIFLRLVIFLKKITKCKNH